MTEMFMLPGRFQKANKVILSKIEEQIATIYLMYYLCSQKEVASYCLVLVFVLEL